MTRSEFLQECNIIANNREFLGRYWPISVARRHYDGMLSSFIPGTAAHAVKLWRSGECEYNVLILETADEANEKLQAIGVTKFYAVPTKSGKFCRLRRK